MTSSARPQQKSVPAPRPAAPAPAPMQQQSSGSGMLSGIGSTIAQGMAFGTGSAIAHRAVGAVAGAMSGGGSTEQAPAQQYDNQPMQQQQLQGACVSDKQMFFECLQVNKGDQQSCSFLYDNLQACQRGDNAMSFS